MLFQVDLFADVAEEPGVDGGEGVDLFFGVAFFERVADVAQAVGVGGDEARLDQLFDELGGAVGFAGFEAAHALAERLFKRSADGHHFADAFHLGAEDGLRAGEFFELPAGNFDDYVIDGRFKTGGRFAGDVVLDFVQKIADGELRGDFGDGKSCGFGRESGATGDARVHLDNDHAAGGGVDGELDVR